MLSNSVSLRLEKMAIPSIQLTQPTKQQLLDGLDLDRQKQSPTKRELSTPTAKQKRVLLRTQPESL